MKKSRFTTEQIIGFIKQADAGMAVSELARQHGFSPASFYQWRPKYGGMELAPQRKREAIRCMCELTSISERRACRLAGLSRDAIRHEPVPTPATQAFSARLIELARGVVVSAIGACTTC